MKWQKLFQTSYLSLKNSEFIPYHQILCHLFEKNKKYIHVTYE